MEFTLSNSDIIASIVSCVIAVYGLIFSVVSFYRTLPDSARMIILTPKRIGVNLYKVDESDVHRIRITIWIPFMNMGGENTIVMNTVLLIGDLIRTTRPLLFERYDRLPENFAPRETAVKTRFFVNGPYARAQLEPNCSYELLLLGSTNDTNQPSFGTHFHATYSLEKEDANFFTNEERKFDGLLKLKKKLGACTPGKLNHEDLKATEVW